MRPDLIVLSASALVVGVLCLVLGAALNPADAGSGLTAAIQAASRQTEEWLAMAVLYFLASAALTCGMPAVLSLFQDRGRRLGTVGVGVLTVGVIGTCGYAVLIVFAQALAHYDAWRVDGLDAALQDPALGVLLWSCAAGFYVGALLVALALLVSRATSGWVPALLLVFVLLMPFGQLLGEVGQVVRLMALALAFTGIAIAAVGRSQLQRTDVHVV